VSVSPAESGSISSPGSAAAPAGTSLVNGNCAACVERFDYIADLDACSLENLDANLLKAHEWPQSNPFDHNYVSPFVA